MLGSGTNLIEEDGLLEIFEKYWYTFPFYSVFGEPLKLQLPRQLFLDALELA